jgi:hypothetical protein
MALENLVGSPPGVSVRWKEVAADPPATTSSWAQGRVLRIKKRRDFQIIEYDVKQALLL